MKNQYFGDINDYRKYGLLRCLETAGFRLGVCWMLTPDDGRSDGRKTQYLTQADTWRIYDPLLFDALGRALKKNIRDVRWVQEKNLIPNSLYFNSIVPADQKARKLWMRRTLFKFREVDLMFFDPDNGIEIASVPSGRKLASKYIQWDEIKMAAETGRALLIFQHFCREERASFVYRLRSQLRELLTNNEVAVLITSNVVYFLIYAPAQELGIAGALQLISTRWAGQIAVTD